MRPAVMALVAAALFACEASPARAEPRIASMNVCTDQLLLSLADPAEITGLSRYAQDATQSWAASEAHKFPVLSGGAEDLLALKPDVVVASLFDKRATRQLLREHGVRLAEFTVPVTLDEVKGQIRRMGEITAHSDRADAEVARLDAALARARAAVAGRTWRVLPLSRRGWVSGSESLIGALLKEVGLRNAADELGLGSGGLVSLEAVIALRPDMLWVSQEGDRADDEGSALLLHPALERFYPLSARLVVPEPLTVCGGVMLADALDRLIAELKRTAR